MLSPIAGLASAAARLASGASDVRVVEGRADEVGILRRAFNEMAERLESARERDERRIDELHEANERLQASQAEVVRAEKLATVGRFAAGVAHEVGNPLAAIRGHADLLASETLTAEEIESVAAGIRRSTDRVDRTIRSLLDFARPHAPHCEPISWKQVTAAACELLAVQPEFARASLRVEIADDIPLLTTDPHLVEQIVVNLLANAAQAVHGDGEIEVCVREIGRAVVLEVADSGPGVPVAERERIFDPFFTTKGARCGHGSRARGVAAARARTGWRSHRCRR